MGVIIMRTHYKRLYIFIFAVIIGQIMLYAKPVIVLPAKKDPACKARQKNQSLQQVTAQMLETQEKLKAEKARVAELELKLATYVPLPKSRKSGINQGIIRKN